MPTPLPQLRLPSIDALRAFEAAARMGTFERAADELAVSASAVAKRVAGLEELLGTALFIRSAKALQPTAAGKEYLAQVSAALAMLAAMPLHQRRQQRLTRLKVSAPPTFARQILVPALEHFTRQHPAIELEVVLSVPYLGGPPDDAAVAVRHGPPGADGAQALMHDQVLPLAAPALLARLPPMRQPADLANAPLLRTPIEPWRPWFDAAGLDWPEPDQGPRLVDLGMTLDAAIAGQGVALVRPSLARQALAAGRLQPLWPLCATPASQYLLLPVAATPPAAAVFADWLGQVCRQAAADGLAALAADQAAPGPN